MAMHYIGYYVELERQSSRSVYIYVERWSQHIY